MFAQVVIDKKFNESVLLLQQHLQVIELNRKPVAMRTFFTPNRHGYSVRFSPFNPNVLVVATSQHYGLAGGGTLFFLEQTLGGGIQETHQYRWHDGLFDVVWSPNDTNLCASVSGDGTVQLWNALEGVNNDHDKEGQIQPMCVYAEHTKEIYSIDWSRHKNEQLMLTASWDCTIKLWDINRPPKSLATYFGHQQLVYNAMFSPYMPNTFASVGGDGCLKIWNTMAPVAGAHVPAIHDGEVLTCDWSKYSEYVLATGGADGIIKGWDIRNFTNPMFELHGCESAVRRIQFSPFDPNTVAAVSYDFTTRLWDCHESEEACEVIRHHSEFNYGLDWNFLRPNELADCGWDSLVHVFSPKCLTKSL